MSTENQNETIESGINLLKRKGNEPVTYVTGLSPKPKPKARKWKKKDSLQ